MAMGIVSDSDFYSEASKIVDSPSSKSIDDKKNQTREESESNIPISGVVVDNPTKGRGNGNIEVPNSLRNLIGQTAIENGRQDAIELAASFGLSGSSVSAYTNGATSTASYDDRPNSPIVGKSKERIAKRARGKLMSALRHITDDKLSVSSAKELSGVAKDMSAVVKQMEEVDNPLGKDKGGPTFVFYSPQFRKEEVFDVIVAKE